MIFDHLTYFKVLLSLKNFDVTSVKSSCNSHTRMHCGPVFSLNYVQLNALFTKVRYVPLVKGMHGCEEGRRPVITSIKVIPSEKMSSLVSYSTRVDPLKWENLENSRGETSLVQHKLAFRVQENNNFVRLLEAL